MIHQNIKDIYYLLLYPISLILKHCYKIHYIVFRKRLTKVHIGCGKNYFPGFLNIDGNFERKVDYLLDVRVGLPFPNESIDFIYSCHMLEHVHVTKAISILKEWHRVLKPSGHIRLTLPDFSYAIKIAKKQAQHKTYRSFDSPLGQAVDFLFCDGQHKYAYTADTIEELASQTGFSRITLADKVERNIPTALNEPVGSFSVNLYK